MIRAVLDTNVIISALFWNGNPSRILDKGFESKFIIVTSGAIINEIERVLLEKFKLLPQDISEFHEIFISRFEVINPQIRIASAVPRDPTDDKIVECAVDGSASFIVTGDNDLLTLKQYKDIAIITPSAFIKLIWTQWNERLTLADSDF